MITASTGKTERYDTLEDAAQDFAQRALAREGLWDFEHKTGEIRGYIGSRELSFIARRILGDGGKPLEGLGHNVGIHARAHHAIALANLILEYKWEGR